MLINVLSSLLFFIPAYVAWKSECRDVAVASVICCATSVMNHMHSTSHYTIRMMDIICVRGVGAYYVWRCLNRPPSLYTCLTLWWSALTVYIYLTLELYEYHWIIHVCAISGILCYIRSSLIVKE